MSGKIFTRISIVAGVACLLALAVWATLTAVSPGAAQANIRLEAADSVSHSRPPARPLHTSLSIAQSAATSVYNGDWITYTLTIANLGTTVKEIHVEDLLPADVLANVQCLTYAGNCSVQVKTTEVTIRDGSTVVVSQPEKVKWDFTSTTALTHTFPMVLKFRGQVLCQPVGKRFTNQAILQYQRTDDTLGFTISDFFDTDVALAPIKQEGRFTLSAAPELCTKSGPIGGTSDMDWGDFDNDGDLDLALVSWVSGVYVYRNKGQGQFELLWNGAAHRAESVQWANFDNNSNGYLELVVGGEFTTDNSPLPDGGTYPGYTGKNYLYRYNGSAAFTEYDQFDTNDGVWRIAAADFSSRLPGRSPDGYPDLAMINYWGGCPVHLYLNDQAGNFNRSDPGSTVDSYCLLGPPYTALAAYSAAWGDVDNDGDPDLAVGYTNAVTTLVRVFVNNAGVLAPTNYREIENTPTPPAGFSLAQDLAWGDYDGDGSLDLAAAFASDRYIDATPASSGGFRVYRNTGSGFIQTFSAATTGPVGALDWADFDGDGEIELIVAEDNTAPKIYKFNGSTFAVLQSMAIAGKGPILGIRGIDFDNEGDLDIAFTNFLAENWLFSNKAPFLQQYAKGLVASFVSNSVEWGDVDNDGHLDLLYGTNESTKLYHNQGDGTFFGSFAFSPNPLALSAVLGDVEGDGDLDMVLAPNGQNYLYSNNGGVFSSWPVWIAQPADNTYSQFFADINQDNLGRPELVVGNNGDPNRLYINLGSILNPAPAWQSPQADTTYGVAWGYYNNDILPDLAAADNDQGVRIYRNTGYDGFTLAQVLAVSAARSVAWGDYDRDGDMDLAVGRYNQPNLVYQNSGGFLSLVWTAPVTRNTTSIEWGDWNNDGDLDLAVGNYNQKDQVYDNLGSTPTQVHLIWVWEAAVNYKTTALRWIDYDADGDLDLSLSQETVNDPNGVYENSTAAAAHTIADFSGRVLLPRVPAYVSIKPPGNPGQVFKRSNSAISSTLSIPLTISAFDPDTSRVFNSNLTGNRLKITGYQYSLNGGGQWHNATVTPTLTVITPSRQGISYATQWLAGRDMSVNNPVQAVSDNVRFRITVSQQNNPLLLNQIAGPVQRVSAGATSPQFRVRNISCVWPEGPYVASPVGSPTITVGEKVRFWGAVQQWDVHTTGITYTWNFGSVISNGIFVDRTFSAAGTHVVTLTVTQAPCPNTRPDFVTFSVNVTGTAVSSLLTNTVYLPLIQKGGLESTSLETGNILPLEITAGAPPQITGLQGQITPAGVMLQWDPPASAAAVVGYRVYRSKIGAVAYQQIADLPASATTFTDSASTCGHTYFVTGYNSHSESFPSTASYYGPPCP
jgi:uncharacterized repeat protein (TIGR01451 family)